ncbi:MAG: flagellar biosynthetic protein FliR [Alkalibacterium sp.]|nr:flagellar biosynthetic protein FliR [Alkalibacterium sp.]
MTTDIQQFLLILIRLTVFISVSPGFSHKSFPTASKLALAVGLTLPVVGTVEGFGAELTLIMFLMVAGQGSTHRPGTGLRNLTFFHYI